MYLEIFRKFGWSRVASLTLDGHKYSEYISHLQDHLQTNGINFIMNRKFPQESPDMSMVMANLFLSGSTFFLLPPSICLRKPLKKYRRPRGGRRRRKVRRPDAAAAATQPKLPPILFSFPPPPLPPMGPKKLFRPIPLGKEGEGNDDALFSFLRRKKSNQQAIHFHSSVPA